MQERFGDGLMQEQNLLDWDAYFILWAERHVSPATWDRIKWNYVGEIVPKIERAIENARTAPDQQ